MGLHEYVISKELSADDPPFYALIMSAIRKADDINLEKLEAGWPEVVDEMRRRYDAPGGALNLRERDWIEGWEESHESGS